MITHLEKEVAVNSKSIYLHIEGTSDYYLFSYSSDGINYKSLVKVNSNLISTETAGGFTGIYLGLFATGNGKISQSPAEFD